MKSEIINLSKALRKARTEFEPLTKGVQAYGYKYAPLPAVYKATDQALIDNNLIVIQYLEHNDKYDEILVTVLTHDESGEFIMTKSNLSARMRQIYDYEIQREKTEYEIRKIKIEYEIKKEKMESELQEQTKYENKKEKKDENKITKINFSQEWGEIYTYFRRYDYCLILRLIGENEDRDGVRPSMIRDRDIYYGNNNNIQNNISPASQLQALLKKNSCDSVEFTKYFSIKSSDLPSVNNAIKNINEMVKKFKSREVQIINEKREEAS